MKLIQYLFPGLLLFLAFFLSCSGDKIAGGTAGSETINTFALVVIDQNNQPVSGASFRLIAGEAWLVNTAYNENNVLLSKKTATNGVIEIPTDMLTDNDCNVCIDAGDIGAFIPSYHEKYIDTKQSDTIMLSSTAQLSGIITSEDEYPSRISLSGTDLTTTIDPTTGAYSFTTVPAGDYHVFAIHDSTSFNGIGSIQLSEGTAEQISFQTDFTNVLVDNFDSESNLMLFLDIPNWYIAKGGNVSVNFPEYAANAAHIPYENALVTEGAFDGKSLHVNYQAAANTYFYLIVGAKVSTNAAAFTNIDTISFQAKGNCHLAVRLHGEEQGDSPQVYAYVDLTSTWQQYTVTSDMFEYLNGTRTSDTWNDVKGRLQWISFLPKEDGTDFWLDDVRLDGVNMRNLIVPNAQ